MKNWQRNTIIVIIVIILLPLTSVLVNPLHRSESSIRTSFLELTPIGISKEEAVSVMGSSFNSEINDIDSGAPIRRPREQFSTVGESHFSLDLGSHFTHSFALFIFRTYVYAYWAFDSENNLIDIVIYKEIDAI